MTRADSLRKTVIIMLRQLEFHRNIHPTIDHILEHIKTRTHIHQKIFTPITTQIITTFRRQIIRLFRLMTLTAALVQIRNNQF